MPDVTQILSRIESGDQNAAEQLLPLVYDELRQLAAQRLAREKSNQTLQPTALVHEAYLRLVNVAKSPQWDGRGHFFAAAAEAMRRILVERARQRNRLKHGGGRQRESFDITLIADDSSAVDVVALDEALNRFEVEHPAKAKVVKLRYFAGLTVPQVADALNISVATAERYWSFARGWLFSELAVVDNAPKRT